MVGRELYVQRREAVHPCRVDDRVVLQEHLGETVLLAIAFDIADVGQDDQTVLTIVVQIGSEASNGQSITPEQI